MENSGLRKYLGAHVLRFFPIVMLSMGMLAGCELFAPTGTTTTTTSTTTTTTSTTTTTTIPTAPIYSVTYMGNNNTHGAVPVDPVVYLAGNLVTVLGNTGSLVRTNYAFGGWNTQADGNGTSYAAASTFTMGSANVILYAKWLRTYSVSYNGNSSTVGTVPVDSAVYATGATVTVLGNTERLLRTGYAFGGWNTQADGNGTNYAAASTFAMGSANVTLYAKWVPAYSVSYSGNSSTGGTVPTDPGIYIAGDTVTVLGNTGSLVRTNYAFGGWNTQADGNGTNYAAASTFAIGSANVTLYAKWLPTFSVTYSLNYGGSGAPLEDSSRYLEGETVTVRAAFTRTDYAFTGWNTAANGSGTARAASSTFVMGAANVTLYAQWVDGHRVFYDGNGATGTAPIDFKFYASGALVSVKAKGDLVKMGMDPNPPPPHTVFMEFDGWSTSLTGLSVGPTFIMGSDTVTLYARWVFP